MHDWVVATINAERGTRAASGQWIEPTYNIHVRMMGQLAASGCGQALFC